MLDGTSQKLLQLATENRDQHRRDYRQLADAINRPFVDRLGDGLAGQEAAEALERHILDFEEAIADVAKRRSRLYWQHLSRRIPPVPLEGSSPWTVTLFRAVLQLAILKHGLDPVEADDMTGEDGYLVPREITYDDYRGIYDLEYLSLELNHAVTSYRRVGKGAVIRARTATTYTTEANRASERLMSLLDKRTSRYQDIFSEYGSSLDTSVASLTDAEERYGFIPYPALNAEQQAFSEELSRVFGFALDGDGASPGTTNYLPRALAVQPLLDLLGLYDDQLHELCGASAEQIIGVLWAVATQQLISIRHSPSYGMQYVQRAYAVFTRDEGLENAIEELAALYRLFVKDRHGSLPDEAEAQQDVETVLAALSWKDDEFSEISLWDRAPHKVVLNYGEVGLWDFSAIPLFLRGLLAQVAFLSGEIGNVKSANFEAEAIALIGATEGVTPWESQKVLVAPDGSKREIDASFIAEDTLYVIECKAFSAHPRIDRGDFAALKARWETLRAYVDQARTLATFLETNHVGRNYAVPDGVARIEGCLCTPLAEAVPDGSPDFWLDEETPRIAVPAELLEFVTGEKASLLE
jgi:hypothetical protein